MCVGHKSHTGSLIHMYVGSVLLLHCIVLCTYLKIFAPGDSVLRDYCSHYRSVSIDDWNFILATVRHLFCDANWLVPWLAIAIVICFLFHDADSHVSWLDRPFVDNFFLAATIRLSLRDSGSHDSWFDGPLVGDCFLLQLQFAHSSWFASSFRKTVCFFDRPLIDDYFLLRLRFACDTWFASPFCKTIRFFDPLRLQFARDSWFASSFNNIVRFFDHLVAVVVLLRPCFARDCWFSFYSLAPILEPMIITCVLGLKE